MDEAHTRWKQEFKGATFLLVKYEACFIGSFVIGNKQKLQSKDTENKNKTKS